MLKKNDFDALLVKELSGHQVIFTPSISHQFMWFLLLAWGSKGTGSSGILEVWSNPSHDNGAPSALNEYQVCYYVPNCKIQFLHTRE